MTTNPLALILSAVLPSAALLFFLAGAGTPAKGESALERKGDDGEYAARAEARSEVRQEAMWTPPLAPTGSIQGQVLRPEQPRRRVAERYPGAGGGAAREATPVPPTVHLEGAFPDAAPRELDVLRMSQRDTTFIPPLVVVPVGTEVAFPNEDPFFHNVFSYSRPRRFDLGRYPQGESKSVRFDEPGYVKVFCEVHEWMRAGILVVENPFYQAVDEEDGTFRLDGVPAGRHTLVVTDFERGTREVEVEVSTGETARVEVELRR